MSKFFYCKCGMAYESKEHLRVHLKHRPPWLPASILNDVHEEIPQAEYDKHFIKGVGYVRAS